LTGDTIGVGEDGNHVSAIEYAILYTLISASAFSFGNAFGFFAAALAAVNPALKDYYAQAFAAGAGVLSAASAYLGGLGAIAGGAAGGAGAGAGIGLTLGASVPAIFAAGLATGYATGLAILAVAGTDPPAEGHFFNLGTPSPGSNLATRTRTLATTNGSPLSLSVTQSQSTTDQNTPLTIS